MILLVAVLSTLGYKNMNVENTHFISNFVILWDSSPLSENYFLSSPSSSKLFSSIVTKKKEISSIKTLTVPSPHAHASLNIANFFSNTSDLPLLACFQAQLCFYSADAGQLRSLLCWDWPLYSGLNIMVFQRL